MTKHTAENDAPCHPACDLGPNADHPGYLGYRCVDAHGCSLPWPGEDDHAVCVLPPGSRASA